MIVADREILEALIVCLSSLKGTPAPTSAIPNRYRGTADRTRSGKPVERILSASSVRVTTGSNGAWTSFRRRDANLAREIGHLRTVRPDCRALHAPSTMMKLGNRLGLDRFTRIDARGVAASGSGQDGRPASSCAVHPGAMQGVTQRRGAGHGMARRLSSPRTGAGVDTRAMLPARRLTISTLRTIRMPTVVRPRDLERRSARRPGPIRCRRARESCEARSAAGQRLRSAYKGTNQ